METTKLIKELVGLCVEKGLSFEYQVEWSMLCIDFKEHICYRYEIELDTDDVNDKLEIAMSKVRSV